MGEKIENGTIQIGEIIGKTLDGKDIYKFTELGMAENVKIIAPQYKDGDFLHSDWNGENITIIYRKRNGSHLYYHASKSNRGGFSFYKDWSWPDDGDFRLATESEKKELIDALAEVGKRWNTEKKCIEDTPVYKDGDFVVSEFGSILIFKEADGDRIFDHAYLPSCGDLIIDKVASYEGVKRHATTEEKQLMIGALSERGKYWNAYKKSVEDIPKRKFKKGDKVRIKNGYKKSDGITYLDDFDRFIGRKITVDGYTEIGDVYFSDCPYIFEEDWLEPHEEPKKGDLAIFWDVSKKNAIIKMYYRSNKGVRYRMHQDIQGLSWKNAIKFESKEQYEKLIKGEI